MRTLAYLATLTLAVARLAGAQTVQGTLTIDGTSNLHAWSCHTNTVTLAIAPADAATSLEAGKTPALKADAVIPVKSLDCHHGKMTDNLRDALKADQHPDIRFTLDRYVAAVAGGQVTLKAEGRLSIAGVERPVTLDVQAQQAADRTYRVTGSKALKMTDFGIQPPTAIFGRLKTGDAITIRFDLTVRSAN